MKKKVTEGKLKEFAMPFTITKYEMSDQQRNVLVRRIEAIEEAINIIKQILEIEEEE